MNSLELMELIGEVNGAYIMDAQQCREGKTQRRSFSRAKLVLLAAAISVLLMGCAYAVMKLQNLRMAVPGDALENVLSLQGYVDSPNYQAAMEWYNGSAVEETGDWGTYYPQPPEGYDEYGCTYQAEVDRVNAICEKYGLVPQGTWYGMFADPNQGMYQALGIGGIHRDMEGMETTFDANCYYYGSGSFMVYGTTKLPDRGALDGAVYTFNSTQKDAFSITFTNYSRDFDEMPQWEYRTACGVRVLLAMTGEGGGLIVAGLPDSFVTVMLRGSCGMTPEVLEAMADTFDFTFKVTPPDPPVELFYGIRPPESSTVLPESEEERPEHMQWEFWPEGIQVMEPVTLYQGQGYSLYIPDENWNLRGSDAWAFAYNDEITLDVKFHPGVTEGDLKTAITPAPLTQAEEGFWRLYENAPDGCLDVLVYPTEDGVYALYARYPMEAAEGVDLRLSAMMRSFRVEK